jgi:hypothetical protein
MNALTRPASPVVAKIVLEAHSAEISEQAIAVLRGADIVHVEINALDASADAFPPATLEFLLRNADRIYGMIDCGQGEPRYWEQLLGGMAFPKLDGGRWVVRLLAGEPSSWEERIQLHSPKGPFELVSPIYLEDMAAA